MIKDYNLEHALYEMNMYLATYLYITDSTFSQKNQLLINMSLESHGIHLRNLADFFSNKKSYHGDDIIYKMFIIDDNDFNVKRDDVEAINKNICHLTSIRTQATNDYNICISKLKSDIIIQIREFINKLNEKKALTPLAEKELKDKELQQLVSLVEHTLDVVYERDITLEKPSAVTTSSSI